MRTLFIAENCHQCAEVSHWVVEHSADTRITNVDNGEDGPPIVTFIYPALFEDDRLIAYGEDIIPYLRSIIDDLN